MNLSAVNARLDPLLPQHATDPLLRSPHECSAPAETALNEPVGGDARLDPLLPQHSTDPLLRSPHECSAPAETALNEPAGGVARLDPLLPQHSTDPLLRSPHECSAPAETALNQGGRVPVWEEAYDQVTILDFPLNSAAGLPTPGKASSAGKSPAWTDPIPADMATNNNAITHRTGRTLKAAMKSSLLRSSPGATKRDLSSKSRIFHTTGVSRPGRRRGWEGRDRDGRSIRCCQCWCW